MKLYLIRVSLGLAFTGILLAHIGGYISIPYADEIEQLLYDSRIRLSDRPSDDPLIAIVAIDEASLSEQGHWPWTRDKLALLVSNLFDYGAAVIGFDVVFAERDESADVDLLRGLAAGPADADFRNRLKQLEPKLDRDRMFGESLAGGQTILGYYFDTSEAAGFERGQLPLPAFEFHESMADSIYLPKGTGFTTNIDALTENSWSSGFISNPLIDRDGVVRRAPLLHEYNLAAYESLSLAVISTYLNDIALPIFVDSAAIKDGYPPLEAIELAGNRIPIDSQGAVMVPYRGPAGSYPYVSATDVIEGKVADPKILKDVIVLVGATAPGLQDVRSTPFAGVYPGVEIHANVIDGILNDRIRWAPAYTLAAEFITVALFGLASSLFLPLLSPLLATLATGLLTGIALGTNWYLWEYQLHVLPLAITLLALFGIYVLNMVFGYFFESRSRSQMSELFGQYVPPDLVKEMSSDPGHYSHVSEKRELTVLFSDIRGFTSIAERLDASELSELMNQFLTAMTQIVHDNRGTIDKYMGDALMAFWGAPVVDEDHASNAVQSGLDMVAELQNLNQRFAKQGFPEIRTGIGISTGTMSVGNMGSQFRRSYTVLGDAVNLGARIEDLTKVYGTRIHVSAATRGKAPEYFFREVDLVRVKGKLETVKIYEPLGKEDDLPDEIISAVSAFTGVLELYRNRQWDDAEQALADLVSAGDDTQLYRLFLDRISHFRKNPPPENWDGTFVQSVK